MSSDDFFLVDEVTMLRFLAICQPSLDPDAYAKVEEICKQLIATRRGFRPDSLQRCLNYIEECRP